MIDERLAGIDPAARQRLAAIADRLIPSAHGMPSAGEVLTDDRLRFVLDARPDLVEPLGAALRPDLGEDPDARLATLAEDTTATSALQLVIVAGYYTDPRVRELIGYPGQLAIGVDVTRRPAYVEEGLIDRVIGRGAVWRDPATGDRATERSEPPDYAHVFRSDAARPEGGDDGPDGA